MAKYFLSFTSTFESLLKGQITAADLSTAHMVFGCRREHVLLPYDRIPIEVTLNNTIKPKHHEQASTVDRNQIDSPVLKAWDAFASQVRKASTEGRLILLRELPGHPSYVQFCEDFLQSGDVALWKGEWIKPEVDSTPPSHLPNPHPPQATASHVTHYGTPNTGH
jgi:hypothetical protein